MDIARKLTEISGNLWAAPATGTSDARDSAKQDERAIVLREAALLCDPIGDILRDRNRKVVLQYFSSNQKFSSKIPLDNIYFERCNFL